MPEDDGGFSVLGVLPTEKANCSSDADEPCDAADELEHVLWCMFGRTRFRLSVGLKERPKVDILTVCRQVVSPQEDACQGLTRSVGVCSSGFFQGYEPRRVQVAKRDSLSYGVCGFQRVCRFKAYTRGWE